MIQFSPKYPFPASVLINIGPILMPVFNQFYIMLSGRNSCLHFNIILFQNHMFLSLITCSFIYVYTNFKKKILKWQVFLSKTQSKETIKGRLIFSLYKIKIFCKA